VLPPGQAPSSILRDLPQAVSDCISLSYRVGRRVTALKADSSMGPFEVGVAVVTAEAGETGPAGRDGERGGALPGYDEAMGVRLPRRHAADQPPVLVVKGGEAVKAATEAIARQIGVTAERIAKAVETQAVAPKPGELGLESVEVSFGVTLTAGVQALFTSQAESSAYVNITLARRPPEGS
jgi:hypothetical protein